MPFVAPKFENLKIVKRPVPELNFAELILELFLKQHVFTNVFFSCDELPLPRIHRYSSRRANSIHTTSFINSSLHYHHSLNSGYRYSSLDIQHLPVL